MEEQVQDPAQEIKRLKRCINDLVSLLALPAIWSGNEPSRVLEMLLDALLRMLSLDFVCARLKGPVTAGPVELLRVADSCKLTVPPRDISAMLSNWLKDYGEDSLPPAGRQFGEDIAIFPVPLGIHGEMGMIVVGSERADFPSQTESILLSVAANQASIGLQEARLLSEQKRIANELDRRVAERTVELAAINEELKEEIVERKLAEERLRQEEKELKRSELHKATILDSSPDCVVAIDHEGCITEFNPAAEQTFGHRRKDVLGRCLADVIIPPSLREQHRVGFARYLARGESKVLGRRLEMTALCADGREIPVELTITRIPQDGPLAFTGHIRDITERKRSEDALRVAHAQVVRSEERWRSVFESSAVGVALTDLNGRFIATNPIFQKMLGYTEQELQELTFIDITHEENLDHNEALVGELLEGQRQQFEIEKRYRCKDGTSVWVRNNVSIVPGTERVPRFLMALSEDVTERKHAEDALKGRGHDLKLIIDTIPALVWSSNSDSSGYFYNQAYLDYTGFSLEQVQGWGWKKTIHPDDLNKVTSNWRTILASGNPGEGEERLRRHDGTYRWFFYRVCPLRDENGNIVKWYGVLTDIEDRKRAEEEIRGKEEFLSKAQRLSLSGSFSWHVDTNEVTFSEEAYRIFGFELGTPITLERIADTIHPDDRSILAEKISGARGAGGEQDYEIRLLPPDGSIKYLRGASEEIREANGRTRYLGAIQDVTARHLAEAALDKARSELAHVARVTALSALTASIAHEVSQPLSGIVTNASTCLRMLDANPPSLEGARETVRRIIRDGNRGSAVITRLRALYSKKEPSPESMDLNEAAREVIALSLSELQRSGVMLRNELAEDLPPVLGDRIQLQQVILNFLRNAADAMSTIDDRPRELLIRTERDEGSQVRLSVKDSGVGLTPQAADRIFEAFYTTKTDGMGIGLSVSRSIIDAHQGRLWATPNDGPGSTFSFSVPGTIEASADTETRVNRTDPSANAA